MTVSSTISTYFTFSAYRIVGTAKYVRGLLAKYGHKRRKDSCLKDHRNSIKSYKHLRTSTPYNFNMRAIIGQLGSDAIAKRILARCLGSPSLFQAGRYRGTGAGVQDVLVQEAA